MEAVVLLPGEGEQIKTGAGNTTMKATAGLTGGAFSMSEVTFPAGMAGPPLHRHSQTTDTFYVLEGILRVTVGDRVIDAPAGSYLLVPPGIAHTFANAGDAPVRFLNINTPGGWEHYLRDLAGAMRDGAMPAPDDFARLVEQYDIVVAR